MAKKKTGTMVMLRPRLLSSFRRSRRDKDGSVLETHVFEPLQSFEVTSDWIDALRDDIGNSLVIVNVGEEDGRPRVDWEATAAVVAEREGTGVVQAAPFAPTPPSPPQPAPVSEKTGDK